MDLNERLIKEGEFYSSPFYFSYSSLNRLLYAPSIFYKEYILKEREIRLDAHLIEGKLIHYLVLDSAQFDDKFIIAAENLPTANVKDIVDVVYAVTGNSEYGLEDHKEVILAAMRETNFYQNLVDDKKADKDGVQKTGDEKRLDKILTDQSVQYYEFLKKKANRDIIDASTLDKCTKAAEAIKANQKIVSLLGLDGIHDTSSFGIYNELELMCPLEGFNFGLKGIIDNMVVNVKTKTVRINDLKTSSKSISDFPESIEYWRYWLQAAVYKKLAKEFLKDVIDDSWVIEFNFIVIDKYNQVYPFKVSDTTMDKWTDQTIECLNEGAYHYDTRDFTLPYKFVAGDVLL
jgi:hypothetical protein